MHIANDSYRYLINQNQSHTQLLNRVLYAVTGKTTGSYTTAVEKLEQLMGRNYSDYCLGKYEERND